MNRIGLYLLLLTVVAGCSPATTPPGIESLRCEYRTAPLGIDTPTPRFTWEFCGSAVPTSLPMVEVATDSTFADAAHVANIAAIHANFAQADSTLTLKPHTRYYWRVTAPYGADTVRSVIAWFETAKLAPKDWAARWISDGKDTEEPTAPTLRTTFVLDTLPTYARAYVSAVGYYDMWLNGQRVGDQHMDPGFTAYDHRSLYATHDVGSLLRKGDNELVVTLGNGFSNVQSRDAWNQEHAHWRGRPQLLCEVRADGRAVAVSDSSWLTVRSDVVYNNIYSGDHIDARVAPAVIGHATEVAPRSTLLVAQACPPIRPTAELTPRLLSNSGDTLLVYDMGRNIAGVCELRLKGEAGTHVKLRHTELLKADGRAESGNIDIYYHPLRADEEFQTDLFILSGDTLHDCFQPRFTYHGFQYVELAADRPIEVRSLVGKQMRTAIARVGHFRCSNDLLNRIYDAAMLSYEGNIHSIPTDCPQREKNGWTADAYTAIDLALLNYDGITLYEKWMRDFIDNQLPSGNISGIIPSPGWGYGEWPGPVWDAALFIVPTAIYDYYGDATIIRELYPTMKRYFQWANSLRKPDGTLDNGIGDWLSYRSQTPTDYTSTLYYYVSNRLMARIATLMGDDPSPYREAMEQTRSLINSRFFDPATGLYASGTQAAQGIALYWDLPPEDQRQRVADKLDSLVVANDYALDFGLLGSKSVVRMLTKYGHEQTAYRMATRTDAPSWGYWTDKCGQTTLAETWVMDPGFRDASLNHVFFGDIAAWMTNAIAGLAIDPQSPGCGNIIINPTFFDEIDWASADYHSVRGHIGVEWRRNGNEIGLTVSLPAGVTATLLPGTPHEATLTGSTTTSIVNPPK